MKERRERIPFNKPFIAGKELYYIAQAVMKGKLSGDGLYTEKCHAWLQNHLRCKKAFLTHSCTAALEMSALITGIVPGDEVIMPSFTFASTANAFVLRGAVPVFIDIRPDTLCLDESRVPGAITNKTKAIVPVHYAGASCDMELINAVGRDHGLTIIEDAAQALLSSYKGKHLGTYGQLGCLSFHETKDIISGEGGALLVNDKNLIEQAEIIREKGTNRNKFFRGEVDKYSWVDVGSSYLPSELIGAFLYAQFEMADTIISYRKMMCENYRQGLHGLEEKGFVRLPDTANGCDCNGHLFYIITRSFTERTGLIEHLNKRDINAVFHYVPLHSSTAGRKYGRVSGTMHNTDEISDRLLRLPLFYGISPREIEIVVEEIKNFYASAD